MSSEIGDFIPGDDERLSTVPEWTHCRRCGETWMDGFDPCDCSGDMAIEASCSELDGCVHYPGAVS